MSIITEEYITKIIDEFAVKCHISRWQHTVRKFETIGQNYFGVIVPVTLTGENDKGVVNVPIVLKLAPTDERYRVSGAVTLMFQREIFVYSVLLEKYRELQSESKAMFIIPEVYFLRDEYCKEVIAMQDMSELGYKPYSHKAFLDLDYVTIALEALARFHALSFVLREKNPKLYAEVCDICIPLTEPSNKRYMDIMTDRLMKALNKFQGTRYVPLLQSLKANCGNIFNNAVELAKGTCICHGDVWKENILFKYDESNKPDSTCLIDYQTVRRSSPAFDALYLIISSTNTALRDTSYYKLLDVYYTTLSGVLRKSGLDSDCLYSREVFDLDLKLVAPACFITANTALWLSNGLQEEGHVRSKHIWSTPEEKEKAVNKYKSVVKSIIDDFYSYGYLP